MFLLQIRWKRVFCLCWPTDVTGFFSISISSILTQSLKNTLLYVLWPGLKIPMWKHPFIPTRSTKGVGIFLISLIPGPEEQCGTEATFNFVKKETPRASSAEWKRPTQSNHSKPLVTFHRSLYTHRLTWWFVTDAEWFYFLNEYTPTFVQPLWLCVMSLWATSCLFYANHSCSGLRLECSAQQQYYFLSVSLHLSVSLL